MAPVGPVAPVSPFCVARDQSVFESLGSELVFAVFAIQSAPLCAT